MFHCAVLYYIMTMRNPQQHFNMRNLSPSPECSNFSPPATVILLILLCFEGLLFLIFTAVMFGTQVHSICTDETVSENSCKLTTMSLVCGMNSSCISACGLVGFGQKVRQVIHALRTHLVCLRHTCYYYLICFL